MVALHAISVISAHGQGENWVKHDALRALKEKYIPPADQTQSVKRALALIPTTQLTVVRIHFLLEIPPEKPVTNALGEPYAAVVIAPPSTCCAAEHRLRTYLYCSLGALRLPRIPCTKLS